MKIEAGSREGYRQRMELLWEGESYTTRARRLRGGVHRVEVIYLSKQKIDWMANQTINTIYLTIFVGDSAESFVSRDQASVSTI